MIRTALFALVALWYSFPALSMAQIDTRNVLKVGKNALNYHEYVWAIQCFNEVINAKSYLWEPYYLRAVAKHYLDDHRGAIVDCDSAISRNPYVPEIYRLRGLSHVRTNHFSAAIIDYDQAIALSTTPNQQDWFNRSLCYLELKHDTAAWHGFNTINRLWPKEEKAYLAKSHIALLRQDTALAYQLLDTTLARNAQQIDALTLYANLLASQYQHTRALSYFDKAISLSDKDARLYFNRALVYYQTKRFGLAINDYDTVIYLSPNNFSAHYNRALLRIQVGEDNLAIEDLNFVIAHAPNNTLARFNRALMYEQVGQYQAAENDLTAVLQQFPNFLYGYEVRARVRQRLGKLRAAANDRTIILRDQLARVYKGKRRGVIYKVRRWQDENIEDFSELTRDENDSSHTYHVAYRGLIQHRQVLIQPQPLFELSLTRDTLHTAHDRHYIYALEHFNQTSGSAHTLYFSSVKPTNDSTSFAHYREMNDTLSHDTTPTIRLLRSVFQATWHSYDEAFTNIANLTITDSIAPLVHWQTATLLHQRAAQDSISDTKTLQAIERAIDYHYEQATKLAPELRPYALYNKGVWLANGKATQHQALEYYNKAIELLPLAQAYFNRGLLLHSLNRTEEAVTDLSRAGELGLYEAYSLIKLFSTKHNKQQ